MTFIAGKDAKVLVNDVDLSAYFQNADVTAEAQALESTTFGKSARTRLGGLKDGAAALTGFFDGGTDAVDEELQGVLGTTGQVVTIAPEGDVVGKPAKLLQALETSYRVSAPVDGLVGAVADLQADGDGVDHGHSHHALAAETATGNSTSRDNAASSANGGVAHLHVTAASGTTPSLTGKIQHSTDNVTFTDLITFTAATARAKERKAVTGTVNRYTRGQWTIAGTGPSFSFSLAFARR